MSITGSHAGPPPHRRHGRRGFIITAVFLLTAVAATGTGLALALASGSNPAAGSRPPAVSAPSSSAFTTAAASAMSAWCAGPGYQALQAVRADITQVGTDAGNRDLAAVRADGTVMTSDAEAAEKTPPPVTRAQQLNYVKAMGALSFAGIDLAGGDTAAASRAISSANGWLQQDQGILSCP